MTFRSEILHEMISGYKQLFDSYTKRDEIDIDNCVSLLTEIERLEDRLLFDKNITRAFSPLVRDGYMRRVRKVFDF